MALAASVLALAALGGLSTSYYVHEHQVRAARAARAVSEVRLLLDQASGRADDLSRWQTAEAAVAGANRAVDDLGDVAAAGASRNCGSESSPVPRRPVPTGFSIRAFKHSRETRRRCTGDRCCLRQGVSGRLGHR